jgi:hypothetical protein
MLFECIVLTGFPPLIDLTFRENAGCSLATIPPSYQAGSAAATVFPVLEIEGEHHATTNEQ